MALARRLKGMRVLVVVAVIVAIAVAFVRQPTTSADYVAHSRADPARISKDVDWLTSHPRCADTPEELNANAGRIADEFRAAGARVALQPFVARHVEFRNVIAAFGPQTGEALIVGAHYDAFCEGDVFPGADDNASGVAGLLELARLLGRERLARPVTLVAFSTEEPPFFASDEMGSAVHARSLRGNERAIILEMIGCFTKVQPPETTPWLFRMLYPSSGDYVAVVGRWQDVPLTRAVKRGMGTAARVISFTGPPSDTSDHRSYWQAGHEAVMITDTGYLRNPRYHTAADTADTLDYARMAGVVNGVLNAVLTMN
jgi:Zn-dependent M28 family amino/carboxypeptidase